VLPTADMMTIPNPVVTNHELDDLVSIFGKVMDSDFLEDRF
jgi:hypothetical protein